MREITLEEATVLAQMHARVREMEAAAQRAKPTNDPKASRPAPILQPNRHERRRARILMKRKG